MTILKISPSSLTFMLSECPRCWYMQIRGIYKRPYTPFPSIFNKIDKLMRGAYQGKSSLDVTSKEGTFDTKEYKLVSPPITIADNLCIQFSGKTDCLIKFDDGTVGILDFKTSEVKPDLVQLYAPQLYAYRESIDADVSRMGLLCASPNEAVLGDRLVLSFSQAWVEIPIDEDYWLDFINKISVLLLTPFEEVQGKATCPHCEYQRKLNN